MLESGLLTGAQLDHLTHHVHALIINGGSYRLAIPPITRRRLFAKISQTVWLGLSSYPPSCHGRLQTSAIQKIKSAYRAFACEDVQRIDRSLHDGRD